MVLRTSEGGLEMMSNKSQARTFDQVPIRKNICKAEVPFLTRHHLALVFFMALLLTFGLLFMAVFIAGGVARFFVFIATAFFMVTVFIATAFFMAALFLPFLPSFSF